MTDESKMHWLVRPSTIRKLWWGGGIVLALTVLAEFVFPHKGHFGIDEWFGFGAVYGFLSCLAMVVFAKVLGFVLKRDEDYYARDNADPEDDA